MSEIDSAQSAGEAPKPREPAESMDRIALASALGAVVLWSSAFVATRAALREIEPGPLILLRFIVASACFAAVAARGGVRLPRRADAPGLLFLGFLGHPAYQSLLAVAQTRITAGVAGVIIAFAPALSALFAIPLLGERLSPRKWRGMALAFVGVALIGLETDGGAPRLDPMALLAFLAAVATAGYSVLQKRFLARYDALDITAYGVWTCLAATCVFAPQLPDALARASPTALACVVYLGVAPTAIAYTLWSNALARAPAGRVSSLFYLSPPMTFSLAWLALGETPAAPTLLGGALAIIGVTMVNGRRGD